MYSMIIINNIVLYTKNSTNEQISGSIKETITIYVNLLDCSNYFTMYMYIKNIMLSCSGGTDL